MSHPLRTMGHMTTQLALIDLPEPAYDESRFKLDPRTREIGMAGIARARAVLSASRQAQQSDDTSEAA